MGNLLSTEQRRVAGWGLLFLLAAALMGEEALGASLFLPPHSTVVLLASIPGDVESERNYREQLQAWLDVLENASPEKVFVFWENPETIALPGKFPAQALKPIRKEFVACGKSLAGQTNPLIVIAWGHGGMQGRTPVFHVRGPRLTPEDFRTFAGQRPQAESHWVLFFRGSGKFASELAGQKRQIISSENETMFASDPIGMSLLLKAAREDPAVAFRALAETLGGATEAWYAERNLARTEEPTLWLAGAKPRLLAMQNAETLASEPSSKDPAGPAPAKSTNAPFLSTNLTAAWKDIERVEPQAYPDADGVVLRRRVSYTFGSSPAIATEHEEFVQVLTAEGKHLGDFDFTFSPPHENITFLDCEVLQANGNLLRLDPDAIRETPEEAVGDYHQGRRKFFSLPGVSPGAVLRVHYLTEWKTYPLPHVSLEIPLTGELPMLDSTLQISVPKESPFHFAFHEQPAQDPALKQTTYGSSYSWHWQNLTAHQHEALAAPHSQAALLISTFQDWADFAGWYGRLTQLIDVVTPEIAAKAAELTRGAKTDREKAIALYNYVTRLRYVAVPMGVNSFRPHAAANVLKNQFGDCKDKANLFNTLLRSLNIEARLVLVPRFTQAHDAVPGLAFNHAISRVTLDGETLWVDTTDDVCRFGLLPPGDPGRKVLVIDAKAVSLTALPLPAAKEQQFKLLGQLDCSAATEELPVTLSVSTLGFADYEMRIAARELRERNTTAPLLAAQFKTAAGEFALEKQRFTAVSALGENFEWQGEGKCIGVHSRTEGRWVLRAPFWLPGEWSLALHQRKTPLFLNQGYPLTLDEEFEIKLPEGAQSIMLPSITANTQEPLRWKIEWSKTTETILAARLHAELAHGELSLTETPAAQQQLRGLLASLAAATSFSTP